jgi:hypothetical protein
VSEKKTEQIPLKRMRDRDVRAAVLCKVLKDHVNDESTLVVEELGVEHGDYRVDIAVVNGFLHGYELKSQSDNLLRLPAQSAAYSRTFDRVTLVVDQSHHHEASQIVPAWWGIKVATLGARGAVKIETTRTAETNPGVCLFSMAHLLWRTEAVEILEAFEVEKKALRQSRAFLYRLMVELIEPTHLRHIIRERLKRRVSWRDRVQPS